MGEEKDLIVIQKSFDKEREDYYIFPKGTMIWPANSGRGVLTENLQAKKIEKKIKGLQGWQAATQVHLYLDKKFWQLPNGTYFGAYARSAREIEVK